MMTQEEKPKLSEKALENLRRNEELRNRIGDSKYVHLKGGDTVVLQFDPENIEIKEEDYKGDKNFRPKIIYTVRDPESQKEKTWKVSKGHTYALDPLLKMGWTQIQVTRIGDDKTTRYMFKAEG